MTQTFDEPIELRNNSGNRTVWLSNQTGDLTLGGGGRDGDMYLKDSSGRNAIHLNGNAGKIRLGTAGNEGDVAVQDSQGRDVFIASGNNATCYIGASGNEGDLFIRDGNGRNALRFDGQLARLNVGATDNGGEIWLVNSAGNLTVRIDAQAGDIELLGADCAEDFDVAGPGVEPGTVMVIGGDGSLEPCNRPYDRRVAGVVSGAGGLAPGVRLDRQRGRRDRRPVALVGKVFTKVDADLGPIELGDMLTTSERSGYGMKATDQGRAFGAILGKALGGLRSGQGIVPVLVALQ